MARKTGVDSLASAIAYLLRQYGEEVDEKLRDDLQYAGEFATNRAREESPKSSGEYSRGWDYRFRASKGKLVVEVGNAGKRAPLTHLLEKGHMDRGGGWVGGRKHIETAYDDAVALLERRMNG